MGIGSEQIVDYKALVGDASDNYPGVPGIGPKTATNLLKEFDSLEGIYRNLEKIGESVRKKLEEGEESARLSQKLARIVTKVPIKLSLKDCRVHDYEEEAVLRVFKKLGFKSLMNKLPGGEKEEAKKEKKKDQQMRLV